MDVVDYVFRASLVDVVQTLHVVLLSYFGEDMIIVCYFCIFVRVPSQAKPSSRVMSKCSKIR